MLVMVDFISIDLLAEVVVLVFLRIPDFVILSCVHFRQRVLHREKGWLYHHDRLGTLTDPEGHLAGRATQAVPNVRLLVIVVSRRRRRLLELGS